MNISDVLPQHPYPITHRTLPPTGGLRTLVAVRPEQFQAAYDLVRRRYAWRGYEVSDDPTAGERFTLLAENCSRLLGTLTVRPHSPLFAEDSYGSEIESLRRQGHRIGEVVKLAMETGADWKIALEALVQSAWRVTHILHGLTDVVIEVNPRHVRFYQRMLGFVVAAAGGVCSRVGAPSVLMRLDLEQFGHRFGLAPVPVLA